ncbi:hypothetical protein CXB51_017015 [Gossypium anomalum]|uniref:Large ribosomal subunit protein eL20 domain-containing protein n=1 Tax=Gossypium anomalum TaxID=47600 RepID=A0A8J6D0H4_9ROSI|nr:hypothetical protein CXB51_017015 [Gossypium anomalum]
MFLTILNYNEGCRVMLSQSKNACWQDLVEMYTGMKRFGPPPVASTFNTLLNGMLLLSDLKDTIFIVEEMYRNHFVPSFTSLSKTLKMAVKVGNLLDGLLVLELMLSLRRLWTSSVKMEREGCNSDLLTYNVILRELCHRDRLDDISELIQVMDQKGLSLDSYSYAALCGSLLKIGKVDDACELLLDIFSNGTADVAVYNIYFQCLCQENKSREALSQLKRKMKARKLCNNRKDLVSYKIFEKNPTKIKNYGIWLRYQSRTGYHNMYKEYRDTTLNGAVEQKYTEIASRHRIIKTATIPAKLCKRDSTKQLHNSKIMFPLVFNKVRPPTRKLKTTYKASKPNLFKFSHCNEKRVNVVYSSKIFGSEHLSVC